MVRLFILVLFLICCSSCSHTNPSPEVKTFVQSLKDQYEPHDPFYSQVYERYITSVEIVYQKNLKSEKFRSYLDSLNNNYQILAHQKSALPGLYKQQTGREVASVDKKDYELFATREMTALSDKLFTARELKIKDEVGEKTYEDLRANYAKFAEKENATQFAFPL